MFYYYSMIPQPKNAAALTPHDTTGYPTNSAGKRVRRFSVYVGVAGDLEVDMAGEGTAVVFSNVPVGWFPIQVSLVMATNTTADSIVAGWDEKDVIGSA